MKLTEGQKYEFYLKDSSEKYSGIYSRQLENGMFVFKQTKFGDWTVCPEQIRQIAFKISNFDNISNFHIGDSAL